MPQIYKIEGDLIQDAADTDISVLRSTGARQDLFQAVVPVYIRLEWQPVIVAACTVPFYLQGMLQGVTSLIELKNIVVVKGDGTGSVYVPVEKEWYRPELYPIMFDEEVEISVITAGADAAMRLYYTMYYEIRKYTELEMVQQLAGY